MYTYINRTNDLKSLQVKKEGEILLFHQLCIFSLGPPRRERKNEREKMREETGEGRRERERQRERERKEGTERNR